VSDQVTVKACVKKLLKRFA